jgi:diacylglycerol O-acyltransferase
MALMPPTDSMFLLAEGPDQPMHVASLILMDPPADAGPDFAAQLVQTARRRDVPVIPTFRKHPASPFPFAPRALAETNLGSSVKWAEDKTADLDYHVRHSALPHPGRIRELLDLTSRLHSQMLDRRRPLWESYIIEGLEDGRVAWFNKVHHSMMDGVTALRALQRAFGVDPDERDSLAAWHAPRRRGAANPATGAGAAALQAMGALRGLVGDIAGMGPALLGLGVDLVRDRDLNPLVAPRTVLNGTISGQRRIAAQSWSTERIKVVAKANGATINDVVCAMVSGAFRAYLLELDALPDDPMTAMVPVSLSLRDDPESHKEGGNSVGAIIVNLATHLSDPKDRLATISESATSAKNAMSGLSPMQALAVSAVRLAPFAMTLVPGYVQAANPAFNIVISNVPGPREDVYFNGARLDGVYPLSIVLDGQAVNVTLISRAGFLDIGIVGCATTLPHLQRLLTHLEEALVELER